MEHNDASFLISQKLSSADKSRFLILESPYRCKYDFARTRGVVSEWLDGELINWGSVKATLPVRSTISVDYFECLIVEGGQSNVIEIGFATSYSDLEYGFDWYNGGVGYRGSNGRIYKGRTNVDKQNLQIVKFNTDDIIGAGMNVKKEEIFFTKNGELIENLKLIQQNETWFPTIRLHSKGAIVEANFGKSAFSYDLGKYDIYKHIIIFILDDYYNEQR